MEYAIIEDGVVTNIVVADEAYADEQGWIEATGGIIGDTWDGEAFTSPPAPDGPAPTGEDVSAERDRRSKADPQLAFYGAEAGNAVAGGAVAGDYRWHGGDSDFVLVDGGGVVQKMDAPTMQAKARKAAQTETDIALTARAMEAHPPANASDDRNWPPYEATAAVIPAAAILSANATLEADGFGPNVFSSPAYTGAGASHAVRMVIGNPQLASAVAQLPDVDAEVGNNPFTPAMALVESAGAQWGETAPALPGEGVVEAGALYKYDGSLWSVIQQFDRSTYGDAPSEYPALIRRVRNPIAAEEWRQPTDQFDAYNLVNPFTGEPDEAIWEGDVYKTSLDANVWSPGDYPDGWTLAAGGE